MTGTTVIVVTYSSADVIAECLAFVDDLPADADVDVVVIDNDSADGTVEAIPRRAGIRVIRNGTNEGFARAVNRAARTVPEGRDILLLNPDAVIRADSLLGLITALPPEGVVAPTIVQPTGRLRIASAGRSPTVWRMATHYSGLSLLPGSAFEGHYLRARRLVATRTVDWATGACLLVSRSAWDRVGGLSERWFMYAEDVKLCDDIRAQGGTVTVLPQFQATHLVGHSAAPEDRANAAWVLNLYDYYCRDLSRSAIGRWGWRVVVSAGLGSRGLAYGILGRLRRSAAWTAEGRRFLSFAAQVAAARPARAG